MLTRTIVTLLITTLTVLGGCGSKETLDTNADRLVKALQSGEYTDFAPIAAPELLADVPEGKYTLISKAIRSLGALQDRDMEGISVNAGEPNKASYKLTFEEGVVKLDLAVDDDRIVGFDFTGPGIERALAARFETFEVQRFEFLDQDKNPNPKGNVYAVGTRVEFRLLVAGLKPVDGDVHLKIDLVLKRADGSEIGRQPLLDTRIPVTKGQPPVARVSGGFDAKEVGPAQFELHVTDVHASDDLVYSQSVSVAAR